MKLSPIISNQSGCMTCKETLSCLADEGLSLFRLFFFGAFLPFNSKSKYCETKTDLTPKHIRFESLSIPSKLKSPLQTRWSLINSLELECSSGNHLACIRVQSRIYTSNCNSGNCMAALAGPFSTGSSAAHFKCFRNTNLLVSGQLII